MNKINSRSEFKDFFYLVYNDMMRYASCFISDMDVAEDIVQESFIYFWENLDSLRTGQSHIGYLKQSIKHRCYNHTRNESIRSRITEDIRKLMDIDIPEVNEDTAQAINQAIEKLTPIVKKVFVLNIVHGLKYHEIAEDLGITVNTVKYHVKTGYKTLRKSFKTDQELFYFMFLLNIQG